MIGGDQAEASSTDLMDAFLGELSFGGESRCESQYGHVRNEKSQSANSSAPTRVVRSVARLDCENRAHLVSIVAFKERCVWEGADAVKLTNLRANS